MRNLILLLACLTASLGYSQNVKTLFQPTNRFFVSVDDLANIQIVNNSAYEGVSEISLILTGENGTLVKMANLSYRLSKGMNKLSSNGMVKTYHNPEFQRHITINQYIPSGSYNLCVTVRKTGGQLITEGDDCHRFIIQDINPPRLKLPDNESILNSYSLINFQWLPPFPLPSGAELEYEFQLFENFENINSYQIAESSIPIYRTRISPNFLTFTNSIRELDTSKSYIWRVVATVNRVIVLNSEIFSFNYGEVQKNVKEELAYNIVLTNGMPTKTYVLEDKLCVSLPNTNASNYIKQVSFSKNDIWKNKEEGVLDKEKHEQSYCLSKKNLRLKNDEVYELQVTDRYNSTYQVYFQK